MAPTLAHPWQSRHPPRPGYPIREWPRGRKPKRPKRLSPAELIEDALRQAEQAGFLDVVRCWRLKLTTKAKAATLWRRACLTKGRVAVVVQSHPTLAHWLRVTYALPRPLSAAARAKVRAFALTADPEGWGYRAGVVAGYFTTPAGQAVSVARVLGDLLQDLLET